MNKLNKNYRNKYSHLTYSHHETKNHVLSYLIFSASQYLQISSFCGARRVDPLGSEGGNERGLKTKLWVLIGVEEMDAA